MSVCGTMSVVHLAPPRSASLQDAMRGLVYRVHPLPETMLDYVFDFGRLDDVDERRYARAMLADTPWDADWAVGLLAASHAFVRERLADADPISLRDLRRFKLLAAWRAPIMSFPDKSTGDLLLQMPRRMPLHQAARPAFWVLR